MTDENKKAHPTQQIHNVYLEDFEAAAYARKYELAGTLLISLLRSLRTGSEFVGHATSVEHKRKLYTRAAAAVTALLADPGFELSEEGFRMLAAEHCMLHALFECSAFESTDHLAQLLSKDPRQHDAGRLEFTAQNLAKWLMSRTLNSNVELNTSELFGKAAETMLVPWLASLSHLVVLDSKSHERREELLGCGHHFAELELSPAALPVLSDAWMYASYGVRQDKHGVKRHMNTLIKGMLERLKVPALKPRRDRQWRKARPLVLVPLDWFGSFHAMHRCYAPSIRQLREKFRVVGFSRESEFDATSRAVFDDVLILPDQNVDLRITAKKILELEPDIIYYPSVGMSPWWVALANHRLAPIQCCTLGHPATTQSDEMDYIVVEDGMIGDYGLFSETPIVMPPASVQFTARPDQDAFELVPVRDRDTVIVAVSAMTCKLNVPFLRALQRIREQSKKQVQFRFFPNTLGLLHQQVGGAIERWLPGSYVYPRVAYPQYLKWLAECDLQLCSWPFGGTNSNVDAMQMGLPLVCLRGQEPHERFDALMLERVGLPGAIADSVEDFIQLGVDFVDHTGNREEAFERLQERSVVHEFCGERQGDQRGAFLRAFSLMYEFHEDLAPGVPCPV